MKYILTITILILSAFFIPITTAQSCITSSEDYATEVVLTDYSLFNLRQLTEETPQGFVFPTEYDANILAVISETKLPKGLSVKLQVPTEAIEIKEPHIRLVSTSATGTVRDLNLNTFAGWGITCNEESCIFEKEKRAIEIVQRNGEQEVTVEISEELEECSDSCSGICFAATTELKCIPGKTKNDLDTILNYFTITNEFEDLLDSYRITGSEEITISDLEPAVSPFINWQEAMRQQLVFLTSRRVLELTRDEIESITALAKRGQAGQNYRIIYDFPNKEWTYYDQTENPVLTGNRDCTEYALVKAEPPNPAPEPSAINFFYAIPTIMLAGGLLILVLLVVIARTSTRSRKIDLSTITTTLDKKQEYKPWKS